MTEKQLQDVEITAGLFFSPEEIVVICELNERDIDTPKFQLAYKKGRLKKEFDLRKSIVDLAVNGSSPAQLLVVQILDKSKLNSIAT
jgi:hypothetical protein